MSDAPDAVLLLSFGGPEAPEEVMPFLERVTGGRGVPRERLEEVAEHYLARGGRSPINDANRTLLGQIQAELNRRQVDLPVGWGNRNSAPYVADALAELVQDGARSVRVIPTSAYPSYSGCRQYREDLARARASLPEDLTSPDLTMVESLCRTEGFIEAQIDATRAGLGALAERGVHRVQVLFVTHSIPQAMNDTSGRPGHRYVDEHLEVARRVMAAVGGDAGAQGLEAVQDRPAVTGWPQVRGWELVYCSRSGPPAQPWLEPDVGDRIDQLARTGEGPDEAPPDGVLVVPIGFISDHMEVVHDLDTEAAEVADRAGLVFERAATVGTHPAFVAALADLIVAPPRRCPADCCPNLRDPTRPAAAGVDDIPALERLDGSHTAVG
ncbi:MAG: ferrochelatase [Actinomycetales bacterium]